MSSWLSHSNPDLVIVPVGFFHGEPVRRFQWQALIRAKTLITSPITTILLTSPSSYHARCATTHMSLGPPSLLQANASLAQRSAISVSAPRSCRDPCPPPSSLSFPSVLWARAATGPGTGLDWTGLDLTKSHSASRLCHQTCRLCHDSRRWCVVGSESSFHMV